MMFPNRTVRVMNMEMPGMKDSHYLSNGVAKRLFSAVLSGKVTLSAQIAAISAMHSAETSNNSNDYENAQVIAIKRNGAPTRNRT